jgi:hypothetical protein
MLASFDDAALGGLITAGVGALAAAAVLIYKTVRQSKRTERKDRADAYEVIFDRQEETLRVQDQSIRWLQQQGQRDREILSRVATAYLSLAREYTQAVNLLYDELQDSHQASICCHEALRRLGEDPGPVKPLRPRPVISVKTAAEVEYLHKTVENDAAMMAEVVKPPPSAAEVSP